MGLYSFRLHPSRPQECCPKMSLSLSCYVLYLSVTKLWVVVTGVLVATGWWILAQAAVGGPPTSQGKARIQ